MLFAELAVDDVHLNGVMRVLTAACQFRAGEPHTVLKGRDGRTGRTGRCAGLYGYKQYLVPVRVILYPFRVFGQTGTFLIRESRKQFGDVREGVVVGLLSIFGIVARLLVGHLLFLEE